MLSNNLEQILNRLSATESTAELQSYWINSYTQLINSGYFILSDQTIAMLQENLVSKPVTPLGSIVLMTHIADERLDENLIQNSIETSVRLLDGLLNVITFTPEAKKVVSQYRKIALSIEDFPSYMETKAVDSQSQEIDYIGNLMSNGSYRASESLAEEKGVCQNWDEIKQNIQPKVFEYWYNTESGEILSGLEISQNYDQDSILQTQYEIVPRRNSHILAYPAEPQWQTWSDRDLSVKKILDTNSIVFGEDKKDIRPTFIPIENILPNLMQNSNSEEPESVSTFQTEEESPIAIFEDEDIELLDTDLTETGMNLELQTPSEEIGLELPEEDEMDGLFQIGELVRVNNPSKSEFGQTMQVVDIDFDPTTLVRSYTLSSSSDDEIESEWMEVELVAADLSEILAKVNHPVAPKQTTKIQIFVFDNDGKLLTFGNENAWQLPEVEALPGESIRLTASKYLMQQFHLELDLHDLTPLIDLSGQLTLGLVGTTTKPPHVDQGSVFDWKDLDQITAQYLSAVAMLESYLQETKQTTPQTQTPMPIINKKTIPVTTSPVVPQYTLQLSQNLVTKSFGDLRINFQYDADGLKMINVTSQTLEDQEYFILQKFVNLLNLAISKGVRTHELAGLITDPNDQITFNELIQAVATSLSSSPDNIQDLNPAMLGKL